MDQPVGLSFLGMGLIVLAIGIVIGVATRILFGGRLAQTILDCLFGFLGAFVASILLPMHGIAPRSSEGSLVAALLGASLFVCLGRLLAKWMGR